MTHDDIRHMLSEYIDGAVTAGEKASVEEHLKTCTECSGALRELRKAVEHIKSIEEVDPPVWMTQKIMARVREEAVRKKGFLKKLFFPLRIKLPLEAAAVAFLAVTAYHIYQNYQPMPRPSEGPGRRFEATKETPSSGAAIGGAGKAVVSAPRAKEVPHTPGYKALDMKQEYEKPAPPVPEERTAAPAERRAVTEPRTAAPAEKREAMPFAGLPAQEEARASKAKSMTSVEDKAPQSRLIVGVKDPQAAGGGLEKAVLQLDGKIIRVESSGNRKVYSIRLNADKFKELIEKLKPIGKVDEKQTPAANLEGNVEIEVELVTAATMK